MGFIPDSAGNAYLILMKQSHIAAQSMNANGFYQHFPARGKERYFEKGESDKTPQVRIQTNVNQ